MNYKDFSQEQLARAAEAKTPEEMLKIIKEEGIELSEETLDAVAGGKYDWMGDPIMECPDCGSKNVVDLKNGLLKCNSCYVTWFIES